MKLAGPERTGPVTQLVATVRTLRMVRRCPILIVFDRRLFHRFTDATVVRYSFAMENSVSPDFTRCTTVPSVRLAAGTASGGRADALASTGFDSAGGAGLSAWAASSSTCRPWGRA